MSSPFASAMQSGMITTFFPSNTACGSAVSTRVRAVAVDPPSISGHKTLTTNKHSMLSMLHTHMHVSIASVSLGCPADVTS